MKTKDLISKRNQNVFHTSKIIKIFNMLNVSKLGHNTI